MRGRFWSTFRRLETKMFFIACARFSRSSRRKNLHSFSPSVNTFWHFGASLLSDLDFFHLSSTCKLRDKDCPSSVELHSRLCQMKLLSSSVAWFSAELEQSIQLWLHCHHCCCSQLLLHQLYHRSTSFFTFHPRWSRLLTASARYHIQDCSSNIQILIKSRGKFRCDVNEN